MLGEREVEFGEGGLWTRLTFKPTFKMTRQTLV